MTVKKMSASRFTRQEADMREQKAVDALLVAESRCLQVAGELALSATNLTDVRAQLEH